MSASRYLKVTFRNGKALAAYLYLPRTTGPKVARTVDAGKGMLVDYAADGAPMGVEITAPASCTIRDVNAVLSKLGLDVLAAAEWAPLRAA